MKAKKGRLPYQCTVCKKRFARSTHLTGHMRVHTGERPYGCDMCDKSFRNSSNLRDHRRIHTGERPYSCEWCSLAFQQSNHLTKHLKTCTVLTEEENSKAQNDQLAVSILPTTEETNPVETSFPCLFCEQIYPQHSAVEDHLITTHFKNILLRFQCDACGNSLDTIAAYYDHKMSHSENSKIPYLCHICNKPFDRFHEFEVHMLSHDEKGQIYCELCGEIFSTKTELNNHCKEHKETISEAVPSKKHGRADSTESKMEVDPEEPSPAEKPKGLLYKCEFCSQRFRAERIWKKHVDWHCKEQAEDATADTSHLATSSRIGTSDQDIRAAINLQCEFCVRKFYRIHHYNNHLKSHLGYRPDFPCKICGKRFEEENKLSEHKKEHLVALVKGNM